MRTGIVAALCAVVFVFGGALDLHAQTPTLTSIVVTPANSPIAAGATRQFTATGKYSDNSTQNLTSSVTWASSDTAKATISSSGLATGVSSGVSLVSATAGSISGQTALVVMAPGIPIVFVTAPASGTTTSTNTEVTITTTATDSDADITQLRLDFQDPDGNWHWQSGFDSDGFTIFDGSQTLWPSPTGSATNTIKVRFHTPGVWHVSATAFDQGGEGHWGVAHPIDGTETEITVLDRHPTVTWVTPTADVSLSLGTQITISASIADPDSNLLGTLIVMRDPAGHWIGESGFDAAGITLISGQPETYYDPAIANTTATATFRIDHPGVWQFLTIASDDPDYNDLTFSSVINVTVSASGPSLSSIAVTPANPSIAVGATQQFAATGTYTDSSTQNITSSVTWASSSTANATINSSGLAAAFAVGTSTISATLGAVSGNTTLTVTLTGPTDSDSNGLTDAWEQLYFGHLGVDPSADADGDGVSNLREFLQWRNPTKGAVSDSTNVVNLRVYTPAR